MKLARQIKAGEVHLAKEMTVVTASCFGEAHPNVLYARRRVLPLRQERLHARLLF
jgi:hypothetical protein